MNERHDSTPPVPARGPVLLRLARTAIEGRLGVPVEARAPLPEWLLEPGASFVTLRSAGGDLRGCIGSIAAVRPLGEDVEANAAAAAFRDPRFPALAREELADLGVEVSVLSASEPLPAAPGFEAAAAMLRPGVDGVILEAGPFARATFLPQVWEELPDARDFLAQLQRKAGLPARGWSAAHRLSRYTVEKHAE
jgi:AmmeMemoRadiSam system protein A